MCGDIQLGKAHKQRRDTHPRIAGTKHQMCAVPEGIAVAASVMCHGGDGGIAVIKGFVIKDIIKKAVNDIKILKHIIGICILPYRHMWLRVFCFPVFTVIQIRNGGQVFQMHHPAVCLRRAPGFRQRSITERHHVCFRQAAVTEQPLHMLIT